jgi:hypothetical protein
MLFCSARRNNTGNKQLDSILFGNASGNQSLPAKEGDNATGVTGGVFKSFSSPAIAPNGRFAFAAKLRGVPGSEDSGVWTTAFNGTLQLALQEGKPVPGLPSEIRLRAVSGISLRNGHLPLINRGPDVTEIMSACAWSSPTVATALLRTFRIDHRWRGFVGRTLTCLLLAKDRWAWPLPRRF